MREFLDKKLRKQLETTVIKARDIAEQAAQEALTRLSVGDASPASYLDDEQRALRNRLRAHGRQLGDLRDARTGQQETQRLCVEIAYEHWHRMLFARFLEQNHLLMYDPHTALTLEECQELAADEGCANGWELAGKLASRMLPQVFRADSPALAVPLAFNHVRALEKLIADLDKATFQAADSLGWVYQYWQAKKKDEVNASGVKIGADELSPVTQLFTEPYMVQFLLDNSLGAWWVTHYPQHRGLLPLTYLRTVPASAEDDSTANAQVPAAGTFDGWPQNLTQFKMLDPCCGSGHFLVATLLMLVPMRMAVEGLSADQAIDAVISQNLHGLELDQRCVELAAFAVALEAWRYPGAGGYRNLPALNIACVGQRIQTPREQWLALAGDNPELKTGMARLYDTFRDAPTLGSLIDPARNLKGDLFTAKWSDLKAVLAKALGEQDVEKVELREASITAQGMSRATEMLCQDYDLIATNVPYLVRGKQVESLKKYSDVNYPDAKNELATIFISRCWDLLNKNAVMVVVSPQNWLSQKSYIGFREDIIRRKKASLIARLGAGAFEEISGEVVKVSLALMFNSAAGPGHQSGFIDVSGESGAASKSKALPGSPIFFSHQELFLNNPGLRMIPAESFGGSVLSEFASALHGQAAGDNSMFNRFFWEVSRRGYDWELYQLPPEKVSPYVGRQGIVLWQSESGAMAKLAESVKHLNHKAQQWRSGKPAWGRRGVVVNLVGSINATIYTGEIYAQSACVIIPNDEVNIGPLWRYAKSGALEENLRKIDSSLAVSVKTVLAVPFDPEEWSVGSAQDLLDEVYTDDPTQWIFHGHPQPATEPLHVAVARLLGYHWPAESDTEMELSDEARAWIARSTALNALADDDGIVCLSPLRGERAAADQLENLLHAAFGTDWTPQRRNQLLEQVGAKSLDAWLRDKFFEQHCKLFHHRPFIWQIWDGLKDGFSALVNYHKLDRNNLERLIYTYLDTWISNQQRAASEKLDGADARLAAAQDLKARLVRILEGEAPYDIFVRWKPLEQQPIGWNPDLNDGVRLNIRPFMTAEVLRHNKKPKLNIEWKKDRGNDVPSAPWYTLGLEYGEKEGARINDHHLTLAEKKAAQK
ncbi:SAM-dependent DNA methyltransferase [Pseudomonas aeruginosa]